MNKFTWCNTLNSWIWIGFCNLEMREESHRIHFGYKNCIRTLFLLGFENILDTQPKWCACVDAVGRVWDETWAQAATKCPLHLIVIKLVYGHRSYTKFYNMCLYFVIFYVSLKITYNTFFYEHFYSYRTTSM